MTGRVKGTAAALVPAGRADVYISFADDDRDWVEGFLVPGLEAAGVTVAMERQSRLGTPELDHFTAAVEGSDRVLLIISPAFLADEGTRRVQVLAEQFGLEHSTWPVVPIRLHPVPKLPLSLSMLTGLDATDEANWDSVLERLLLDMRRGIPAEELTPECPYPGMSPYREDQHDRFFGRRAEIDEVLARLRLHPFLALVGPSGCGKSSLLYAGVVPALPESVSDVVTVRPGSRPLDSLIAARDSVGSGGAASTVLIVDQLEELFTHGTGDAAVDAVQRDGFCAELLRIVSSGAAICIVAFRADYYPQVMGSPLWEMVSGHRLEILPLTGNRLREAIVAPAQRVNVHIEAALVQAIVHDAAGQPGSLPLIQETLVLLWGRLRRRYLPISAYDALVLPGSAYGEPPRTGLQVALARRADEAMAGLAGEDERMVARRIFLRLVQLLDGRDDVRRQQRRSDLYSEDSDPAVFDRVLQRLIDARLVICTMDESTEDPEAARIDLAHEAIIAGWPALRGWIAERRAAEYVRRQLEAGAQNWVRLGRGRGGLLDEAELGQAKAWLDGPDADELGASSDLLAQVAASRAAIEDVRRHKRRLDLLFRGLTAALAVLLAAVLVAALIAVDQRGDARAERDRARSGELGLAASALPPEQVDRALLLATEGLRLRRQATTVSGMLTALRSNPSLARIWPVPDVQRAVDATTDGSLAVIGGEDGTVLVLDPAKSDPPRALGRLEGELRGVAVSRDGGAVTATSSLGEVVQWSLTGGAVLRLAGPGPSGTGHEGPVRAAAYSPDGRLIATGGDDGRVLLHDAGSGVLRGEFRGYGDWINDLAFTPDGATLIGAGGRTEDRSEDTRILLWDVSTRALRSELPGHEGAVRALAVSPDGQLLASGGAEGSVRIWALPDGRLLHDMPGHSERIFDVDFSPDGARVASAGRDQSVRLWDAAAGRSVGEPLLGHGDSVRGVAFAAADRLLSVGGGGRLVLWDVGDLAANRIATALSDQPASGYAVAVDPSAGLVATGDDSGLVVIRQASDGAPTDMLLDAQGPVSDMAFGPGGMLVAATFDGRLLVWDLDNGEQPSAETRLEQESVRVAVSPDGRTIAAGGHRGVVELLDPDLEVVHTRLLAHENWVEDLAFRASDGALLSVGADGAMHLWTALSDDRRRTLFDETSPFGSLTVSPDGRVIAAGNADGEVVLYDTLESDAGRAVRAVLAGHEGMVTGVAFDPSGGRLVTTDEAGTVRLWDAGSRLESLGELGRRGEIHAVSAVPGADAVFTTGVGGPALWTLDVDRWIAIACDVAGRNLTAQEAAPYGFDEPPVTCPGLPGG